MFKTTSSQEKNETVFKAGSENGTISLIAVGTEIKGDFSSKGDVRIDGKIKGNVSIQGKLVLGKTSEIIGNIIAQNAEILGNIDGDLSIGETLILTTTSVIKGNIKTKKLIVESGSVFLGNCSVGANENDSKKTEPLNSDKRN